MNSWLTERNRPCIVGHRGASAHAPENTLAAFRLAREQGADAVELDAQLCASGEVVVLHDDTLDRTTNGKGPLSQWSLDALRALDAGKGERVPLLSEVFEEVGSNLLINVEVKIDTLRNTGLEAAVVDVVRRHNIAERILLSSFNPLTVRRLAALAPDIPRAFIYSPEEPVYLRQVWFGAITPHQFRHPHHSMVTAEMVEQMRKRNLRVSAWTVDDPADIRRMAQCGVYGIVGNSPLTIRKELQI